MLMPDEKLWANQTVLTLAGGDAQMGAATLPRYGGRSAAAAFAAGGGGGGGPMVGVETYKATRADLKALFSKVEAHHPASAGGVRAKFEASLGMVDIWKAPPVPVVCIIGSGTLSPRALCHVASLSPRANALCHVASRIRP